MKQRSKWSCSLIGLLALIALVAAACGSGDADTEAAVAGTSTDAESDDAAADDDDSDDGGDDDSGADTTVVDSTDDSDAADDEAAAGDGDTDGDGLLSDEEQIAYLTAGVEGDEWGVSDDNVLRGPAGYSIDLNACPSGWSDTGGVTDSEVVLGVSTSVSGTLASYGLISAGQTNYYDYVNSEGGVGGRDIRLVIKDDAYEPARTISNVQ